MHFFRLIPRGVSVCGELRQLGNEKLSFHFIFEVAYSCFEVFGGLSSLEHFDINELNFLTENWEIVYFKSLMQFWL